MGSLSSLKSLLFTGANIQILAVTMYHSLYHKGPCKLPCEARRQCCLCQLSHAFGPTFLTFGFSLCFSLLILVEETLSSSFGKDKVDELALLDFSKALMLPSKPSIVSQRCTAL